MTDIHSHSPDSTVEQSAGPDETEVKELLAKLGSLWQPLHRRGLEVRHDTGRLLNALLGPPGSRQQYGLGTCKQVSERIGVSRSEVSRMRKFAFANPDLGAFQRQHPEWTWTKVKAHLGTSENEASSGSGSAIKRLCRSLRSVIAKVEPGTRSPPWRGREVRQGSGGCVRYPPTDRTGPWRQNGKRAELMLSERK